MLADAGARFVIVGHSERRTDHHETDAQVRAKALAAQAGRAHGHRLRRRASRRRETGETLRVVGRQLAGSLPDGGIGANLVVAYEPVWAIGTGLTPTPGDVAEVHAFIRQRLEARYGPEGGRVRILYGGSVKPPNARGSAEHSPCEGALVGGASLIAADFLDIASVYR